MKTIVSLILFTFFALSFFACGPCDEINPDCVAHEPSPACICYEIYDPVCGCDGVTYGNDCFAECQGIFDYEPGRCED